MPHTLGQPIEWKQIFNLLLGGVRVRALPDRCTYREARSYDVKTSDSQT